MEKRMQEICIIFNKKDMGTIRGYIKAYSLKRTNEQVLESTRLTNIKKYGVDNPFKSNEVKDKIKQTKIERYGVDNPSQSTSIKDKKKQTTLLHYGVESSLSSQVVRDKGKQTLITRYGVDNPSKATTIREKAERTCNAKYGTNTPLQNDEIKDKIKQTNMEKYGVEYSLQREDVKEQIKRTNLEKYNCEYPMQNEVICNKMLHTNLEKYGTECSLQNKDIKVKTELTNMEKYGTIYPMQNDDVKNKVRITSEPLLFEQIKKRCNNVDFLFTVDEYTGVYNLHPFKCKKCGNEFMSSLENGKLPRCYNCYPLMRSHGENEVYDYVQSLLVNIEVIQSDRLQIKPLELDIYIPSMNIAIEYCGLYWHSIPQKDKNYHINKHNLCKEKGIRLITIFEDEWIYKQDIVKQRLSHILQCSNKIYARKCTIVEVDVEQEKLFLNTNHIQGYVSSQYCYGLMYEDKLVAIMSFGKRYKYFELLRFCSSISVVGGASKLFKHFLRQTNETEIVSYCDNRWGTGELYNKLGFTYVGYSLGFYWTDLHSRFPRQYSIGKQLDESFTKIYDCGQGKYSYVIH
jgi:hypothetical protein